jgi:hypothetical protein
MDTYDRKFQAARRITSISCNNDATLLAAACEYGTIEIWNTATGVRVAILDTLESDVRSDVSEIAAFAWLDHNAIVILSMDYRIEVWGLEDPISCGDGLEYGKWVSSWIPKVTLPVINDRTAVTSSRFKPNRIAVNIPYARSGQIKVFSFALVEIDTIEFRKYPPNCLMFNPINSELAVGYGPTVRIYRSPRKYDAGFKEFEELKGHTSSVTCIAYTKTGKMLATGSGQEVRLWNAQTGRAIHVKNLNTRYLQPVMSIAFNSDNSLLATVSKNGYSMMPPLNDEDIILEELFECDISSVVAATGNLFVVACGDTCAIIPNDKDVPFRQHPIETIPRIRPSEPIPSLPSCGKSTKDLLDFANAKRVKQRDNSFKYTYELKGLAHGDETIVVSVYPNENYGESWGARLLSYHRNNIQLFTSRKGREWGPYGQRLDIEWWAVDGVIEIKYVYIRQEGLEKDTVEEFKKTGGGICTKAVAYTIHSLKNQVNRLDEFALDGKVYIESRNPCSAFNCYNRAFRANGFKLRTDFGKLNLEYEKFQQRYKDWVNDGKGEPMTFTFSTFVSDEQKYLEERYSIRKRIKKSRAELKKVSESLKGIRKLPPTGYKIKF